ncbi:small ribosomal subunit Rsm22 family protein [Streptomyces melanogenes]|uniref:small ribosomal subunit Rsm22 family protein n=1 Tax=Streptomyces melanogenes TaxID=67326 RepID=UPI00167E104F|nr:small ribosomal subunit Rsm22 family protein [Streptomyces melanogenes]GGP40115.1 rRNA methyltransferase [Streptomyces melanogenes]
MNENVPVPQVLRSALAGLLDGLPPSQAAQAVDRLIANYRGATQTHAPVLRDRSDVAAYAAYRMPATFEAVRSALAALQDAVPDWTPATHTDVGGGTGAASWAVAEAWDAATTVLDWAEPALAIGRELADASGIEGLGAIRWERARIGTALSLPETDLVTVSYVLNELTPDDRRALVDTAARAATGAVVIVEPGTPDGYARIIEARDRLIAAGFTVAAPCPHSAACPIEPGTDWCHFSARVSRSSLHRQVKGGSLAYEDEKFSYVAAVRGAASAAGNRVVRRPQIRKGQVLLDLCTVEEGLRRETVTKRHGALYRAARDASWGDAWPPAE